MSPILLQRLLSFFLSNATTTTKKGSGNGLFTIPRTLVTLATLFFFASFFFNGGCNEKTLQQVGQVIAPGVIGPGGTTTSAPTLSINGSARDYLFCFWNVENLFDDLNNNRSTAGDKEYDSWMSRDTESLRLKLTKLTDVLLRMNGGRGPDILCVCEVESLRAAELLQWALNTRIGDPALQYPHVLMKEVSVGRHIAPAIISRLPVIRDRTRDFGSRFRIIQGHIVVEGQELVVLASHWTSRLKEGNEKGRMEYADKLYGAANAIYHTNPQADVIICGDFNDTPQDISVVQNLRATADHRQVRVGAPQLQLFNLMGNKDPNVFGSHYYNRWFLFDQLVVSPGMLDSAGWNCDPATVQTVKTARPDDRNGRPWRFGGETDAGPRGYSDHFPVTVRLRVASSSRFP